MWGRLRALVGLGHQVDVLVPVWEQPCSETLQRIKEYASEVLLCGRYPMWQGLLGFQPCQVSSRRTLASVSLPRAYDALLLDGDATGAILDNPTLHCTYQIVRTHNCEAQYHLERSRIPGTRPVIKVYDRLEARRYPQYSSRLFRAAEAIWWVSQDELADACSADPSLAEKSEWLPHFHDVSRMHPFAAPDGRAVLFVGALSSSQNIEAALWYFDHIHPRLKEIDGYRFVVAGGTDNRTLPAELKRLEMDSHVVLLKDVPDLRPVYAAARVFANPVQHGAGINSKTIHAVSEGLPIVTTTPGFRGTGLKEGRHLLVSDSPDKFADHLRSILQGSLDPERMVSDAQDYLRTQYDHALCLQQLIDKLERRLPANQGRSSLLS